MEKTADWGFRSLVCVLGCVGVWLLMMPWIPAVSQSLMNRFHLRSSSFAVWAIQQPIPSMYSFRNTTEIRDLPLDIGESGLIDPLLLDPLFGLPTVQAASSKPIGIVGGRTINHFPTREITFANSRHDYLSALQNPTQSNRWFVLESAYRGQKLRSIFQLSAKQDGTWEMTRVDE